jgi:hypothetical protein
MLKPAPVIAAEFTTTGDVPADVSVNDCVVAVFTVTLPKLKLAALTVNCGLTVSELDGAVPDPHPISVIIRQVATSAIDRAQILFSLVRQKLPWTFDRNRSGEDELHIEHYLLHRRSRKPRGRKSNAKASRGRLADSYTAAQY